MAGLNYIYVSSSRRECDNSSRTNFGKIVSLSEMHVRTPLQLSNLDQWLWQQSNRACEQDLGGEDEQHVVAVRLQLMCYKNNT